MNARLAGGRSTERLTMLVVPFLTALIAVACSAAPASASTGSASRPPSGRGSPREIPRIPCCGGGGPSYNGAAAAAYADKYVGAALNGATGWDMNYQPVWQRMEGDDCTEYVSEALVAGGLPWVDDKGEDGSEAGSSFFNYQNNWEWWLMDTVQTYVHNGSYAQAWSDTASVAPMLRPFLLQDGGFQAGTFSFEGGRNSAPNFTPSPMGAGDLLFYDWGTGEGISHAAIEIGAGKAANGKVGSLVDEHSSNRKHAFWSLKDYDPYWRTMTVYFIYV